jgi:hypothetical protein
MRELNTDLRRDLRRARRDDHSSRPQIASGLQQPTRGSRQPALASLLRAGWASPPLLFGLAPRGVFRAPDVAIQAVGSYPTFSPLPNALDRNRRAIGFPLTCRRGPSITGGLIFCGTFRSRALTVRSRPLALAECDEGVTPWRYQARRPYTSRLLRAARLVRCSCELRTMGVRTFLPFTSLARSEPAIIRLTR